jgi:hypothetical protein
MPTKSKKAKFIKIKIIDNGKKIINLTIPIFLLAGLLFFIPKRILNKWVDQDINIKEMFYTLKKQGKGTQINVNDGDDQVKIEFK